jgi:hypothetical protein
MWLSTGTTRAFSCKCFRKPWKISVRTISLHFEIRTRYFQNSSLAYNVVAWWHGFGSASNDIEFYWKWRQKYKNMHIRHYILLSTSQKLRLKKNRKIFSSERDIAFQFWWRNCIQHKARSCLLQQFNMLNDGRRPWIKWMGVSFKVQSGPYKINTISHFVSLELLCNILILRFLNIIVQYSILPVCQDE